MIDVSSGRPIALISELFRFVRRTQISIMIRSASLAVLLLCPCFAQAPLTFEVASIKLADPDAKGSQIRFMPGGGLNITNVPVRAVRKASPRRWRCWRKSYSNTMGRPVVDKTSLLGKYDFVLERRKWELAWWFDDFYRAARTAWAAAGLTKRSC